MKRIKTLGLASLAAMALMASSGAGTASATVLVGSSGVLAAETTLEFTLSSGTSAKLTTTEGEALDTCSTSKVKGEITNAGGEEAVVTGSNQEITWSSCTFSTKSTSLGKLEIKYTSGSNGTVTADSEIAITVNTVFFGSCIYGMTAGTSLGTLTGGNPSTFDASAVAEKLSGSGFACPSTAKWSASYTNAAPEGMLQVAAAPEYRSSAPPGPVVFKGVKGAGQKSIWGIGTTQATCAGAEYKSPSTNTPAKTLKLAPKWSVCTNFTWNGTSEANGCEFELLQPQVPKPKADMESNVAIRCPSGNAIKLVGAKDNTGSCEVLIEENANNVNLAKNRYKNLGGNPSKFEVIFEVTGITGEVKASNGTCGLKKGPIIGITYTGEVNIEDEAKKVGVSVG